jgi:hypothetical protein
METGHQGKFNVDGLRIYLESKIEALMALGEERDKRYRDKFLSLESATEKALVAVREQTAAAFRANEVAISKAEEAQRSYNERSNEFRGQLDDQAKRLMPREEALSKFIAYDEKLEDGKREIIKLREQQMESAGRTLQRGESKQTMQWGVGQAIAIALVIAGFVVALIEVLLKTVKP